jgi:hypothetical protein
MVQFVSQATFFSPVETPHRSVRQRLGQRLASLAPKVRQRLEERLDTSAPILGCSHSEQMTMPHASAWLLSPFYPLEIRGKGSATGSITHWVLDLIIASTVLTLINTITETGTFWLYAAFGIIGILFFRVVPETKGRSLEDIEEELERRVSTGSETEAVR